MPKLLKVPLIRPDPDPFIVHVVLGWPPVAVIVKGISSVTVPGTFHTTSLGGVDASSYEI